MRSDIRALISEQLTTITLTNHNSESEYTEATISIASGKCTLINNQDVTAHQLINDAGFIHPLLKDYKTDTSTHVFHYEYDDLDGLLRAPTYVYSSLLKSTTPQTCKFKISPSPIFQRTQTRESLYFSINAHQPAQELITILQFEAIVSGVGGYSFKFINNLFIDEEISLDDLPSSIQAGELSKSDNLIKTFINSPCDLNRFEIRYIGPVMKFGVFSRERIKEGEMLFCYGGKKKISKAHTCYSFVHEFDCLNLTTDAREFGNLARFINHAPDPCENASPLLLVANIVIKFFYISGHQVIIFSTTRDIEPGEQLLVNYGALFFKKLQPTRFKSSNKAPPWYKKIIAANSLNRLNHLRIMAHHGVKDAVRYLRVRTICIISVIWILTSFLIQR